MNQEMIFWNFLLIAVEIWIFGAKIQDFIILNFWTWIGFLPQCVLRDRKWLIFRFFSVLPGNNHSKKTCTPKPVKLWSLWQKSYFHCDRKSVTISHLNFCVKNISFKYLNFCAKNDTYFIDFHWFEFLRPKMILYWFSFLWNFAPKIFFNFHLFEFFAPKIFFPDFQKFEFLRQK